MGECERNAECRVREESTKHDSYYIFLVWALGVYHFLCVLYCSVVSPLSVFFAQLLFHQHTLTCMHSSHTQQQTHTFPIYITTYKARNALQLADWLCLGPFHIGERYVYKSGYKIPWIHIYMCRGENMMKYGYVFHTIWTSSMCGGCVLLLRLLLYYLLSNLLQHTRHIHTTMNQTHNIRNVTTFRTLRRDRAL